MDADGGVVPIAAGQPPTSGGPAAASSWTSGRLRPSGFARLAHLVFLVFVLVTSTRFIVRALPNYLPKDWSQAHEFDGLEDWLAARYYVKGENPYGPEALGELKRIGIGHPPTTTFWSIPLARLDKAVAAEIFDLLSWLFLLVHLYLCAREVKFPSPLALAVLGFAWFLTTDGMTMHWHAIQISEHIALPLVVAWVFLRRGRQVPAGIALGIAATFKLFPGLLMLMLLVSRRFVAFAVAAAVYLGVAIFVTATYGIAAWPMFFQQQQLISRAWMGSIRSASLQGIVLRAMSPICQGNVLPLPAATVLATGLGIGLLVFTWWLSRPTLRQAREQDHTAIDLPFALVTMLAIFLNPWIWEHYHVFLIQPAFVILARLLAHLRGRVRGWLDEEEIGAGRLGRAAAMFLVALVAVAAVVRIYETNVYAKMTLEGMWRNHPTPWVHGQMHLMEVLNWLPWAIMIALGMGTVAYLSPPRGEGRGRPRAAALRGPADR